MTRGVASGERGNGLEALRWNRRFRGRGTDPDTERNQRSNASHHGHEHSDGMRARKFVDRLAAARIGTTHNFYREGEGAELRRDRLAAYLEERASAPVLLVGEAPGFRGARISGVPFTSERQLTGAGPAESTATIVQRALAELDLDVLCWNVVPTHPGTERSNRRPTRPEVEASREFLEPLARRRRVIAVGRLAERVTGAPYVRHPSHGGAAEFKRGLELLEGGNRRPCC